MEIKNVFASLDRNEYDLGRMRENVELLIYASISFAVPFALGHPQLLVGSAVNAMLVMGALNLKGNKLFALAVLPSIAIIARGIVLGPFTPFLLIMAPFIWIGNFALIWSIKELFVARKNNRWLSLGAGSLIKGGLLFAAAFLLVNGSVLPAIFLTAMGMTQIYTVLAGGVAAFGLQWAKRKMQIPYF